MKMKTSVKYYSGALICCEILFAFVVLSRWQIWRRSNVSVTKNNKVFVFQMFSSFFGYKVLSHTTIYICNSFCEPVRYAQNAEMSSNNSVNSLYTFNNWFYIRKHSCQLNENDVISWHFDRTWLSSLVSKHD